MSETIFMIHGMWCGPWVWDNFERHFREEGYQCLATTLRYHDMDPEGLPDPRLGTTSLLDYAEDLEQEIRALGEKPIVMGHSMGGVLAQILGSRGLAKALVLLTPGSPAGILALRPSVIKAFLSVQMRWGFWRRPMRQTFNEAAYSMLQLLPRDEQEGIYDRLVYESGRAACEIGYWFFDSKGASRVEASAVTCPVLVIAGAKDRMTPASVVRRVASKYRAVSTYEEFADSAHWVLAEPGWQEVARCAGGWLREAVAEDV